MRKWSIFLLALFSLSFFSYRHTYHIAPRTTVDCEIQNIAIYSGEEINYSISYHWGIIWLEAGQVTFKVEKDVYKGIPCYKMSGTGGTYPSYDWIYKVRDRFECWVDTVTLKPYRYLRDIHEGGRTFYNECFFNYSKKKAYCVTTERKKSPRLDTVSIESCTFDPLTMIYFSRNVDFSKYKSNDTIPISLFLDNHVYPLYFRYLGKEMLKLDDKNTFKCIKFSPKLVDGTIFKGGEGMTVWGTDDQNKIPLYVEAPILVGTVRVSVVKWNGLRNKIEAKQ